MASVWDGMATVPPPYLRPNSRFQFSRTRTAAGEEGDALVRLRELEDALGAIAPIACTTSTKLLCEYVARVEMSREKGIGQKDVLVSN